MPARAPRCACSQAMASRACANRRWTMRPCWPTMAVRDATAGRALAQDSSPMQHLAIVTTGGTIDKIYFDDKSTFQIGEPQIGDILEALGVAFTFEVLPVLRKDSLHMDDEDR